MQNNFSKCREWVPRGTSQHKWRWLTTLLLILTLGIGQMWAAPTDMEYAYTYSSGAVVTGPTTDDFFTPSAPTFTGANYEAKSNSSRLRYSTKTAGAEATVSFQFTAKDALKISAITMNNCANSDKIKAVKIRYRINTGSWSTDQATTVPKSDLGDTEVTLPSAGLELAEDDVLIIQVDLKNTDTGTSGRAWDINTITIATEAASGGGGDPVDETAPTLSSSTPANEATDVAVSGNIVLTMSENVTVADASKFSLTGGAGSLTTASISVSGAAITIPYTGLANSTEYTFSAAAGAIQDGASTPNTNAAFSFTFTTAAPVATPDYLLINQSTGAVNTEHFRTTSTTSTKSGGYSVSGTSFEKYIQLGGAYTTPVGYYETNKVVAYDAETNDVTVEAWIYNKANSDYKFYISIIEEGAEAPTIHEYTATKNTGTKFTKTFTPSTNATIYFSVGNNSNVFICQAGIYENGTALKKGGEIGYTVNLTSTRFADNKSATALKLDGIEYKATSNSVKVLTSGNPVKLKATTEYIKFTLTETEKLSIAASGTYSVTKSAAYDSEKAISNNQDVVLTEGTWYIVPNGSNVIFASLTFATPPTMRTITLQYADGTTADGSIQVVDGTAATKPADPTRGKYTFLGWFVGDTDDEYVWSSTVNSNITLKAHWQDPWTITFDANGGSAVDAITVKHNTKADKPEDPTLASNEFEGWFIGDTDTPFDWDANVTANYSLKAHWLPIVAKYDIEYYDGATKIGTEEQVRADQHPTAAGIETSKSLYHFDGWFLSSALTGDPVNLNTVTPSEGLKIYGKWSKAYAADIDFEAFIDANGTSGDWQNYLSTNNYAISNTADVSLDNQGTSKPADKGLKMKNHPGAYVSFNVNAGKLVLVKMGRVNGMDASVDGGANYAALNGSESSEGASVVNYLYNASEAEYRLKTTVNGYNIIQSITITDPYQVSFNTHGADEIAAATFTGTEITLPTPTNGTGSFKGWYDAAEGGTLIGAANAGYTPTADITLHAQWETVSTVNTLSDLQVDGATVEGFDPATNIYYLVYEYGQQPEITSATATSNLAEVTINNTPVHYQDDDNDFWYVQVKVVPESGDNDKKFYQVRYTNRPKKGVELIKVMIPNGTGNAQDIDAENITGYIGGTANQKLESGKHKLGSGGHYIGITLAEGTFLENDLVNVNIETVTDDKLRVFSENTAAEAKVVAQSAAKMVAGVNTVTLGATTTNSLYLRRGTNDENYQKSWNPFVGYISVERYMNPFIESFKIGTVSGTIDEVNKTIAIELPHNTDLTGIAATVEAYANGGATVDAPAELAYNTPLVYTVSSAYTEDAPVAYTVTITEAAAIKEVVIDGTLAVLEGENTTLSAVVYDTNDEVAAIQDVTWSVKAGDTDLASVDANGVVTGKAVGTAHIIATSVADNTKSAEVAVVVSENPCRAWSNPSSKETGATIGKMVVTPTGIGALQENMTPYQGASATNAWKLDSKDSRYAEIKFTDNAQFESLLLGVSSKDNDKNYKFAVVCSSAAGDGFAAGVLSATTYEAVDQDEAENLVDVELPVGTKAVRVYRQYTNDYGGDKSVFLYYINACKKELVALTSIAVADKTLAVGVTGTPAVTLTPANADVNSYAWEIVNDATGDATINATTGAVSSTATGVVTVKVTATDALNNVVASNVATVNIVNKFVDVAPVTETTNWNWSGIASENTVISDVDTVLANYYSGSQWERIAGKAANDQYAYRAEGHDCYQGTYLFFKTTVPGMLTINSRYASSGAKIEVNGNEIATLTGNYANYSVAVPAGDVKIVATGGQKMRIKTMKFDADFSSYELTDNALNGYTRPVTEGNYGTICLPKAGVMVGASIYTLAYYGETSHKFFFDEVVNGTMEAGKPYLFLPNEGVNHIGVYYTDNQTESAKTVNGLVGYIGADAEDFTQVPDNGNCYIIQNNLYRQVLNGGQAFIKSNRAYIDMTGATNIEPAKAPGARRIGIGAEAPQVTTGADNLNVGDQPVKLIIDGQMYILRGEKMYDATGRLVK